MTSLTKLYRASRSGAAALRGLSFRALSLSAMVFSAATLTAVAQDLTAPPRIDDASALADVDDASAAATEDSARESIEEIVVISDTNPWRLPDLGSSWRPPDAERSEEGRIAVDVLPLWNPEQRELPVDDPFRTTDSIRRVGFIEVFRVSFGGR